MSKMSGVLGVAELRSARITFTAIATTVVLCIVIALLVFNNIRLTQELASAREKQVMYGFQNPDGLFESSDVMPVEYVQSFANLWVSNYLNFTPESAEVNLKYTRSLFTPPKWGEISSQIPKLIGDVRRSQITQIVAPKHSDYKVEASEKGYVVTFEANRRRLVGDQEYQLRTLTYKLYIVRTHPNEFYRWGLLVHDYEEGQVKDV